MRITNRVVTEKYLRSVNNIASELDRLNNQVYTQRRFTKVSEDTPAAVKAFQIRKDLSRVEGYQSSIRHAQGTLQNSESSIMKIQELLHDAREKIIQGQNGTQSSEERAMISTHLKNLQQQMLQLLNSNSADIYYFGGTSVRQEPFSVAEDGSLQYRCKDGDGYKWIKLSELSSEPPSVPPGNPAYDSQKSQYDLYQDLMKAGLFVDIGMGVRSDDALNPPPTSGIDRNSVFTYTLPGIEITGVGTVTSDVDGRSVSANIYDLLGEIANRFTDSDYKTNKGYEKCDEILGLLYGWDDPDDPVTGAAGAHHAGRAQTVQFAITNVGTKMKFLEFVADTMSVRKLDDQTQQMNTESISMEEAIIYFDAQKITYQAALSMGAQVIPMSIFNYMS
jgi:flagellar hook-associated protein 3 FlgL